MARTRNAKKAIFARPAAFPAIPPNPRTAATMASSQHRRPYVTEEASTYPYVWSDAGPGWQTVRTLNEPIPGGNMNDHVDSHTASGTATRRSTIAFEGYIGEMNDERVVVFPCLEGHYSIEIQRGDVLEFEAGRTNGACRFVVSGSASILERITVMTTTRRARNARDISWRDGATDGDVLGGWAPETDWSRPD